MKPYWEDAGKVTIEKVRKAAEYFTNPKYIVGDHIWTSADGGKTYTKVPIKEK